MSRRLAIGLAFEGVHGGGDKILCVGYGVSMPQDASTYAWRAGLTAPPQTSASEVDPLKGEWTSAGLRATLDATNELCAIFLAESRRTALRCVAITAASTSLTLSGVYSGEGSPYLWIGDECLKITAGTGPSYTVARGQLGTTAEAHETGDYVHERPPYWVPRPVRIRWHDLDTGEAWGEWTGYVDSVQTDTTGARIEIAASELYSRWRSAQANVNAQPLQGFRFKNDRLYGIVSPPEGVTIPGANGSTVALHMLGALVPATKLDSTRLRVGARLGDGLLGSAVDFDAEYFETVQRVAGGTGQTVTTRTPLETPVTTPVWQVLVWDRSLGIAPSGGGVDAFHPIRIASYLLGGNPPWGLRLPIDTAGFSNAASATTGLAIDRLVLGLDGEPYSPFEIAEGLMRAYGFAPTRTWDGKYSVKRIAALDVATAFAAAGLPVSPYTDGPLQRRASLIAGSSTIEAQIGTLPWEQRRSLTVNAVGGSRKARLLRPREVIKYDLGSASPARAEELALQLATTASLHYFGLPRITIRVADWRDADVTYGLLDPVTIADLGTLAQPWWVDAQGVRIGDLTGRVDAIGVITGVEPDWRNRTYTLTVALLAFSSGVFARERAPAGVIEAIAGTSVTLGATLADDEASYFRVKDIVQAYTRAGVALGSASRIDAIVGSVITTQSALTGSVGDVLRLVQSAAFFNSEPYSPLTNRAYVFLADSDEVIDRPSAATEPADPYGGALGIL